MPTQPLVKLYDLKNGKNMGELKIGSKNRVNSYLSDGDGVMAANDSVIIVAYHYKKQIDIYDVSTLKLKKQLITPAEYPAYYRLMSEWLDTGESVLLF